MRLCLVLGCTLDELGQRMSAREFGWWAEFYRQEPFGDTRGDVQAGIVAATVANMAGRTRTQQSGAASPSDFVPKWSTGEVEGAKPVEIDPLAFFNAIGKG